MSYVANEREIDAVLKMNSTDRYGYFIEKVADWEEIWGLRSQAGWTVMGDTGNQAMPIWPNKQFASLCATAEWTGYEPSEIRIDDWLEKWIPGLTKDDRQILVFPSNDGEGVLVDPQRLGTDILEAMEQYE